MLLFFLALAGTIALVLALRRLACRLDLVDHPGGRKRHEAATPTIGGVAMFGAVALALLVGHAYTTPLAIVTGCAAASVLLGTLDDKCGVHFKIRLGIQALLALVVILAADGKVAHLGALLGGSDFPLGLLAVPFSLVAYVGGINSMNMIDGADGMAGKMAIITAAGAGAIFYLSGNDGLLPLVFALLGALAGFLLFNARLLVSRAWVFMGDAGSTWLGLVLGWFMAQLTHPPSAVEPSLVLWLFGIPVIDTLAVIARRLGRNVSPFTADLSHIHHILQRRGFSPRATVLLLSIVQCLLVGIGLTFYLLKAGTPVVFGSFALLMAVYIYLMQRFEDTPVALARMVGRDHG
jgi:UDP-GlcNAc:undecaprenyl-phosphate GlcNAc-1-phosphate transferase